MGYTCFGFTFTSFQCFKPIPSVELQMKFSCNFQLHSITHLFSAFTTDQFSFCLLLGPPFCSVKKVAFCSTSHLCKILTFFPSALPCISCISIRLCLFKCGWFSCLFYYIQGILRWHSNMMCSNPTQVMFCNSKLLLLLFFFFHEAT